MPRATTTTLDQGLLAGLVDASVEVSAVVGQPAQETALQVEPTGSATEVPAREVYLWLADHGLEEYATQIVAQGYDKLLFLRELGDEEVEGLTQSLKMPHPHARALRTALTGLVPAGAVATGAPPTSSLPDTTATVVMAEPTPNNIVVGQPAWLRIPSGPWVGKWVPCVVENDRGNEHYDVQPKAGHRFSCTEWTNVTGSQFRNRSFPR